MKTLDAIIAIARADFLERVRRYSYLVTLLFAVYLGYAAATGRILIKLGDYRGLYTSAWIGSMMALVTTLFVSLVGFYVVKNAIDRDRQTRVGDILAATPLSKFSYLLGKFLSNFAVLASMVLVLAVAAFAMQFFAAEDRSFHLWSLFSPFVFVALPTMALTAAVALLFETVRYLRGGFGNVLWFFIWAFGLSLPEAIHHREIDSPRLLGRDAKHDDRCSRRNPGLQGFFRAHRREYIHQDRVRLPLERRGLDGVTAAHAVVVDRSRDRDHVVGRALLRSIRSSEIARGFWQKIEAEEITKRRSCNSGFFAGASAHRRANPSHSDSFDSAAWQFLAVSRCRTAARSQRLWLVVVRRHGRTLDRAVHRAAHGFSRTASQRRMDLARVDLVSPWHARIAVRHKPVGFFVPANSLATATRRVDCCRARRLNHRSRCRDSLALAGQRDGLFAWEPA